MRKQSGPFAFLAMLYRPVGVELFNNLEVWFH